ncbi:MAG: TerB family tellurite resistance protein [Kiritimatiellia bacterium]
MLFSLIKFILVIWIIRFVIRFVWRFLIAPFFVKETPPTHTHYLQLLMPLLAKIAKSDGHISPSEINGVERIFLELSLSDEEQRFAKRLFNESKDSDLSFETAAHAFAQNFHDVELRVLTLMFMARVAVADGEFTLCERQMLARTAHAFNLTQLQFEMILRAIGATSYRGENRSRPDFSAPSRTEDLALFGLSANASAEQIKKAYRQKVKELHPDRLQSQGLPQSILRQATERMSEINAAYARLIK